MLCLTALGLLAQAALSHAFEPARPGYRYRFPRDHAAHERFRTEWWYYAGHLTTESGRVFGFQLTFFRSGIDNPPDNPSRWTVRHLYLAHFAISDLKARRHVYFEKLNRAGVDLAGAATDRYRVWNENWLAEATDGIHRLKARADGYAVDLEAKPLKPPVIHGRRGVSRKGPEPGQASHYYSLTRLAVQGILTVAGKAHRVTGTAWMDHEFGSGQLSADQVGWDWFGLQLDDGTELMLYRLRRRDGTVEPASSGTWITRSGKAVHLARDDAQVDVLAHWSSPASRGRYPMGWRIRVPRLDLDCRVSPAFPEQELITEKSTGVTYWEGSVSLRCSRRGKRVTGRGYVELVGYAEAFRRRL